MSRRVGMARTFVLSLMLTTAVGAARAGWADRLFPEQRHDFGPVPRGAKVRHAFTLTNVLAEPVTVVDIHASCGCTTGRATGTPVAPGESTTVEAEMDTKNFVGKKATTLYVTLVNNANGREAEVRLGISSMILSDIVLNPGTIDFGSVARGTPTQTLTIDRVGMPGWKVNRMVSTCRVLDATLTQTARDGETVAYRLTVALKAGTPPGTIRDEIQLLTNDAETPVFPVQVTATVRGDVSASPGVLALGDVDTSGTAEGRFLVRATRPFVVRSIEGEGGGFRAKADDGSPKRIHFVTVTYRHEDGKPRGDLRHNFRLQTDLDGEPPLDLSATLHVEP